ncbi:hypothetical protein EUX98_g8335 [Antrodiella citrinella]|uniref:Uncharacterized protein n=1 Tax=Antrodiella citrinella TaxID=2447956 RepID=A0A4S4M8C6_9APHY|nr:hypothetical protein EUX98_g8335 [Antrodiella citrinella]
MLFNLISASVLVFGLALQAQGHAIISPALGVTGTPVRNDVQQPSSAKECGNVNIASTLGSTTPIVANADGSFNATIQNFNAGKDGSRQVKAVVDGTATGKSFVAATVTKNGDLAPTNVGTQQLTVQLPANTKCTGGSSKDSCLVSFTTAGGFGNCVVVQQKAAGATATKAASSASAASASASAAAGKGKGENDGHSANNAAAGHKSSSDNTSTCNQKRDERAVGTRAARTYREMEEAAM